MHTSQGSPCALTKPLTITPTLLGPTDISEGTSPGKSNTPRNNTSVCKVQPEAGLSQATQKPAHAIPMNPQAGSQVPILSVLSINREGPFSSPTEARGKL